MKTDDPSEAERERAAVVALLRDAGMEAVRMILAAGLPGGTSTQRVKNKAFAEGCSHATSSILAAIERGEHRKGK